MNFAPSTFQATLRLFWPSVALAAATIAQEPDLIVHHGKILTVDRDFRVAPAMAIAAGRIVRVGSDEEILKLKGPRTEVIDLAGKMVVPGLIDSHTHPLGAAMTEFEHEIPAMESIPDVLDYIRRRAEVVPEGEWIVVQQVFITRLREQRYPSRAELDAAAPKHPVVFRTGPDASFNSRGLSLAGVDRNFKIPEGVAGRIEVDAAGEPTGILRNFANYVKLPERSSAPDPTPAQKAERLKRLFKDYNSVGITSIGDRSASPDVLPLYQKLRADGELTVRIAISHHIDTAGALPGVQARIRQVADLPLFREKDPLLRIIGIKTFLDGGMLTGSAYMRQPWGVSETYAISDPSYRGVLFIPKERLRPIVETTVESGLQFTAHAVGDGAVHTLLEVYDDLAKTRPIRQTRPCLTHSNFMSAEAVEQIARLGVVVDLQPAWLYLDTRTLIKQFGNERLRWFQPLHTLFAAGAIAGGGSDHMQKIGPLRAINPYHPFLGMWVAITRRAKNFDPTLHPEEALTRAEAIRFYTANNAFLLFAEQDTGSLEPGKLADFIVLDTDLLTCAVDDIPRTKVLRTYLGGALVHALDETAQRAPGAPGLTDQVAMTDVTIRPFRPEDLDAIKQLTVASFGGVTLEENVENALGILHDHDWRWRKSRHIDDDVATHPDGIFVAVRGNQVAGYITTRIDREAGKGRIPNLAVAPEFRGQGLGRRLIEHALDYFQSEGLAYAMIETMAQNEIGQHLYPACGFVEVARQIHFARKL